MTSDPKTPSADDLHTPLGGSIGSANVAMLREHTPCSCVRCQLNVLRWAIRWSLHGEPIDAGLPALEELIHDMLVVRRLLRQHYRFNVAMGEQMKGAPTPDTDGRPN